MATLSALALNFSVRRSSCDLLDQLERGRCTHADGAVTFGRLLWRAGNQPGG